MTGSLVDAQKKRGQGARRRQGGAAGRLHKPYVGTASVNEDFSSAAKKDLAKGEAIGLPLALIVLLVVFARRPRPACRSSFAVIAIVAALALTALLGEVVNVNVFATNMITTMGLAVGIDYTLFIVSRFARSWPGTLYGRCSLDGGRQPPPRRALQRHDRRAGLAGHAHGAQTPCFTSLGAGAILVVAMAVLAPLRCCPLCSACSARGSTE